MLSRAARGTPIAAPIPQIMAASPATSSISRPLSTRSRPSRAPSAQRVDEGEPGLHHRRDDGLRDTRAMLDDKGASPRLIRITPSGPR
jgi:hypothetical protein